MPGTPAAECRGHRCSRRMCALRCGLEEAPDLRKGWIRQGTARELGVADCLLRRSFHAGGQLLLSCWGPVSSSSGYRPMSVVSAPFWHAAGMTSLEDRYRSVRLDVLIHTCWPRAYDDPLLTVNALGASQHLARAWPTDLPLRRSFHGGRSTATSLVRADSVVVWLPLDVRGFRLVTGTQQA